MSESGKERECPRCGHRFDLGPERDLNCPKCGIESRPADDELRSDGGTEQTGTERYGIVSPIDEHPIPTDDEELAEEWNNQWGPGPEEEAPHPDVAHEEYTHTIAEHGTWHVFRLRPPFGCGAAVYVWNREGHGFVFEDDCGSWHELVNLFAEIVDEEGDCRDADYSTSLTPSGSHDQRCESCGAGWSI